MSQLQWGMSVIQYLVLLFVFVLLRAGLMQPRCGLELSIQWQRIRRKQGDQDLMVHVYNPTTQKVEAGGSEIQGYSLQHNEFQGQYETLSHKNGWCWRHSSAVRSTYCSHRRPKFHFQHPYQAVCNQLLIILTSCTYLVHINSPKHMQILIHKSNN